MPNEMQALLAGQLARYPGMEVEDAQKLLFQHAMGPGHLIDDEAEFTAGLQAELALPGLFTGGPAAPEPLGNGLCRVHLSAMEGGPTPPVLARLCALGAARFAPDPDALLRLAALLRREMAAGRLPWHDADALGRMDGWLAAGCPQPRHSARYRALYDPHYRVLPVDMAFYLPVLRAVDAALARRPHVLVGIDGMSAAGKSTLAGLLQAVYGCGVVHADDFFLRPGQRSAARLAHPGGNIDHERLAPVAALAAGQEAFDYEAYDCQSGGMTIRRVPAGRLTLLEGAYALHPLVAAACDVAVFLWLDSECQRRRIAKRNPPALAQRFYDEWIPMENRYFAAFGIRERCDVVLDTGALDGAP